MEPVSGKTDTSRGPADKAIEPMLELSAAAQIRRREVAKDSLAFHARTETIVHTTRWQEKFTAFLERLGAVTMERAMGIEPMCEDWRTLSNCSGRPLRLPTAIGQEAIVMCAGRVQRAHDST